MPPLQAALERIQANRANRVSKRIRRLRAEPDWDLVPNEDKEAILKTIRDEEEERYKIDRDEVQRQYQAKVEVEIPPVLPGDPPPTWATLNNIASSPAIAPVKPGPDCCPDNASVKVLIAGNEVGGGSKEEKNSGVEEVSKSEKSRVDSRNSFANHPKPIEQTGVISGGNLDQLIAVLEQSAGEV